MWTKEIWRDRNTNSDLNGGNFRFRKFPEQSSRNFRKASDDIWSVESFGKVFKVSIFHKNVQWIGKNM